MNTFKQMMIGFVTALIVIAIFFYAFTHSEAYLDTEEVTEAFVEIEAEPVEIKEIEAEPVEIKEIETEPVELPQETEEIAEPEFIPLDIPLDAEVQEYLKAKCEETNIDFALVLALIDTESNFNADAHSKTNDYGLMQINKCNHKWLSLKTGATDFLDPYQNIDAGMYMLENLFEKYEEAEMVLMAYHFGESGSQKLWNKGTYTSKYSQAILEKQETYQSMMEV